jgi:hypothetical protein
VIEMKILRGIGAALVWVLATVVMIVAALLCVTVVLLPLGLPLMALGLRLYGYGVQLMIPGPASVKPSKIKRSKPVKRGKKAGRKARKRLAGVFGG